MRPGAWRSRLTADARHSVFPIRYYRGDAGAPSPETHGAQRRFCSGSMPQRKPFPGSPYCMDYSYDMKGETRDGLFCGMPCEPGTPLEEPPCATRPAPARAARREVFLHIQCSTRVPAAGAGPL